MYTITKERNSILCYIKVIMMYKNFSKFVLILFLMKIPNYHIDEAINRITDLVLSSNMTTIITDRWQHQNSHKFLDRIYI